MWLRQLQVIEHEKRETDMALRKAGLDVTAARARVHAAAMHASEARLFREKQKRSEAGAEMRRKIAAVELERREADLAAREQVVAECERLEKEVEAAREAEAASLPPKVEYTS